MNKLFDKYTVYGLINHNTENKAHNKKSPTYYKSSIR